MHPHKVSFWVGVATTFSWFKIGSSQLQKVSTNAVCAVDWAWSDNGLGQSPCLVSAFLLAACNGGVYNVNALPSNNYYPGPTVAQVNPCRCSTVVFSTVSACALCQGETAIAWSTWSANCSIDYIEEYPENIPSGTEVPGWAFLDVVTKDGFNASAAQGDLTAPESTFVPSLSGGTGSSKRKTNVGAVAGGVVAGIVILGAVVALSAFLLIRKRSKSMPESHPAYMSEHTTSTRGPASPITQYNLAFFPQMPPTPMSEQKYYNPSDPSTFPNAVPDSIYTAHSVPDLSYSNPSSRVHPPY